MKEDLLDYGAEKLPEEVLGYKAEEEKLGPRERARIAELRTILADLRREQYRLTGTYRYQARRVYQLRARQRAEEAARGAARTRYDQGVIRALEIEINKLREKISRLRAQIARYVAIR